VGRQRHASNARHSENRRRGASGHHQIGTGERRASRHPLFGDVATRTGCVEQSNRAVGNKVFGKRPMQLRPLLRPLRLLLQYSWL
jgi:hypothetical protein